MFELTPYHWLAVLALIALLFGAPALRSSAQSARNLGDDFGAIPAWQKMCFLTLALLTCLLLWLLIHRLNR